MNPISREEKTGALDQPTRADQQAIHRSQHQLVGALAGGIAHDFNNILTAVICQIELVLLETTLSLQTRNALTQALQGALRGAELNNQLMEFSRQTEARPARVDPARVIEEVMFLLRRSIDRRIEIHSEPAPDPVWAAWVDEAQLKQSLMHLCLNARDAMPRGGRLSFRIAHRVFGPDDARPPRQPGKFIQITVSDDGCGMTAEVLARLFEPYFTTRKYGRGAGLGLSIANHIVVEHGGWMEVESQPGAGSRFHIFLPRAEAAAPQSPPSAPPLNLGPALEGYETILLVDDEQSLREVICAMLTYRGYQVTEAADGIEALECFAAAKNGIDLVLLDLQMPRLNGWDTLARIRALDSEIPIVLLSGAAPQAPANASATRASGFLKKPFSSPELLRMVRAALDRARRAPR